MKKFSLPLVSLLLSGACLLSTNPAAARAPWHAAALTSATASENLQDGAGVTPGSIRFSPGTTELSTEAKTQLSTLAGQMRGDASYRVVLQGHGGGNKFTSDRVANVIQYLTSVEHIESSRIASQISDDGDENVVDYR